LIEPGKTPTSEQNSDINEVIRFEDISPDTGLTIRGAKNTNGLHGLIQFIGTDGFLVQRANYVDGKLNGLLERFDKGEKIFEQEFVDGLPHGFMRTFDKDNLVCEQYFDNGTQHGSCLIFSAGKLTRECSYHKGRLQGQVIEYNDEGGLIRKEYFEQGLKNGSQYVFWPNGQILQKQDFKNGIPQSAVIQFNKAGKRVSKIEDDRPGIVDAVMDLFNGEKK